MVQANGLNGSIVFAEVAQLVEHRSEKPGVVSSILTLGTFFGSIKSCRWEDPIEQAYFGCPSEKCMAIKLDSNFIQLTIIPA